MRMRALAHRLADQHADASRESARHPQVVIGTVATVTAGKAADGNALVTITIGTGAVTAAGYGPSYTPAAGDRVSCLLTTDNQLIVNDKIIGYP